MKTIKNLLYVLVAFAALAFVGCVKDDTYTEGGDISGDKVYISNAKSTFYVQSKEDKEKAEEELEKLNKNSTRADIKPELEDDKQIELEIGRNAAKLDVLDVTVELTMLTEEASLFTLPQGSTKLGSTSKTTTYSVPVSFAEGADKAALVIGFDVHNLVDNYDYEFNAALGEDVSGTQYGSSDFDFAINHMVPVELPFTDIGTITIEETFFRDMLGVPSGVYSNCVIQIHNDDLKAINDAKSAGTAPKLDYDGVRFFIPKFMYQVASASIAAGDGAYEEDDLEVFANGDGLMLTMTLGYEPMEDAATTHPHPLNPKQVTTGYPLSPVIGVSSVDGSVSSVKLQSGDRLFLASVPLSISGYGETYIVAFPQSYNFGTTSRVNNVYTFGVAYWALNSADGTLWPSPFIITWDTNKLEEDWANYFKVDYNNDLMYTPAGEGTFKSEYKSNEASKNLYKGYESIAGNTVFYVADPYGTSTEENPLGLALLWNGTTATVVPEQPLGEQAFGKDLYISQSDDVKSAIEFAENGSIAKITFGVKIHFADGNKVGDYAETIEFAAADVDFEKFIGSFTHGSTELQKCPVYDTSGEQPVQISPDYGMITSQVTISKDPDNAPYGVIIDGLIGTAQMQALGVSGGTLKGTYDPVSNSVIIPAQFYYKPVWQLGGMKYFPYFVPVVSEAFYDASNPKDPSTYYYASEVVAEGAECALYLTNDADLGEILILGSSSNDGSGLEINGFAVAYYVYDSDNNEFVAYYYNNQDYLHFSLETIFMPQTAAGTATASINRKSLRNINPVSSSILTRPKTNIVRTAKVYPFGK
ncbi:MAG: hypothetical protein J6K28_01555 [Alistipes sp.]|nr:hypothetical protein [Alistipes sp.]